MSNEHKIIQQVYAAKEDSQEADRLIGAYMPFIKAETAKFLQRPPIAGYDAELSIALLAFHAAICGYSRPRGSFLKYAAMLINSRLIDYHRKEKRHGHTISLDTPIGEEEKTIADILAEDGDHSENIVTRDATRQEIEELTRQMEQFAVSLTDVAENCPRQQRTLQACRKALLYAQEHPELMDDFLRTKRLPIAKLAEGGGVERKTLERHRKYMVALLLIYTNGFEIIRGHLKQVMKGGAVR